MNHPKASAGELERGRFSGRVLIFDLDGTLIDSVPDIAVAVDRTLLDLSLPPAGEEQARAWVGNGVAKLLERALRQAGGSSTVALARATDLFMQHYAQEFTVRSRLYQGVGPALASLAVQGRLMAVCTNKPSAFVQPLLRHFGVAHYFAACIGGDDLPVKKPDPGPLLHLARLFGAAVVDCLMVGDSRNDVEAARAAGMPVVAVSYGYNHGADIRDSGPDVVIDSMEQLPGLLGVASA